MTPDNTSRHLAPDLGCLGGQVADVILSLEKKSEAEINQGPCDHITLEC